MPLRQDQGVLATFGNKYSPKERRAVRRKNQRPVPQFQHLSHLLSDLYNTVYASQYYIINFSKIKNRPEYERFFLSSNLAIVQDKDKSLDPIYKRDKSQPINLFQNHFAVDAIIDLSLAKARVEQYHQQKCCDYSLERR